MPKKVFASFDLCSGYWQFLLDKVLRRYQIFISTDDVYTSKRVLHGQENSVTYLKSMLNKIYDTDLIQNLLISIYDILLHLETVEELLKLLSPLFKLFRKQNLR